MAKRARRDLEPGERHPMTGETAEEIMARRAQRLIVGSAEYLASRERSRVDKEAREAKARKLAAKAKASQRRPRAPAQVSGSRPVVVEWRGNPSKHEVLLVRQVTRDVKEPVRREPARAQEGINTVAS